jgi:hypothetical protein
LFPEVFILKHKGKALCIFSPTWIKFGIGDNHITPSNSYEFHVKWCCESHNLLEGVWEILPFFCIFNQIWIKLCTGALQKNLLSGYEFLGNRCSESLPLLAGIHEYPYFPHL